MIDLFQRVRKLKKLKRRNKMKKIFLFLPFIAILFSSPAMASDWFTPFSTTDDILLGLNAAATGADMWTSSVAVHQDFLQMEQMKKTQQTGTYYGEGNPLIRGLFKTPWPSTTQYAEWGVLQYGITTFVAWALPDHWRKGFWGLSIGVGTFDSVSNSVGAKWSFAF